MRYSYPILIPGADWRIIMATYKTGNFKHLTLISKEIRNHRFFIPHYHDEKSRKRVECAHFKNCSLQHLCGRISCTGLCSRCRSKRCSLYYKDFIPKQCEKLSKPPYVCNNCPKLRSCSHDFYFYRAKHAEDSYQEIKRSSRRGINQSPESLEQLDRLISPLLRQGQPLSHIYLSHKNEINCSQRTLYHYIDQCFFSATNLDLPRKVSYKPRKKVRKETAIPGYRMNRTYECFEQYMAAHPEYSVVEMDVVEGSGGKSGPVLLTLFFRSCSFMLIFLMSSDRQEEVQKIFDFLYGQLGAELYVRLFPVILTDNGSSFKNPDLFEREDGNGSHTSVFYCNPMASWQKGALEKNHEFIRYVLPKGRSFSGLTQCQATLLASHINSIARASLNGCTPFRLAQMLLDKKLINLCHLKQIPPDQVMLKPTLLK